MSRAARSGARRATARLPPARRDPKPMRREPMYRPTAPAARARGFSLTELLIVVAIVGILAAIGLPMYRDYSLASKRSDAQQALLRMSQLQERYFTERNVFAATTTALGYGADPAPSNEGLWNLSVVAPDPTAGYTLQAVPRAPHADAECAAITLDSAGIRAPTECWSGR